MTGRHSTPDIITIDDDNDDDGLDFGQEYRQILMQFLQVGQNQHNAIILEDNEYDPIIIDNSEDEDEDEEDDRVKLEAAVEHDLEHDIAEFIDILDNDWAALPDLGDTSRNKPVEDHLRLPSYRHNGMQIMEGAIVEINLQPQDQDTFGIEFLEVQLIRKEGDEIIVRGVPYARTRKTRGQLPPKRNEVVAVLNIHEDDLREWTTQAAIEVNIKEILQIRQLQFTNALYPAHRYDIKEFESPGEAEELAVLTCRWKMVSFYKSTVAEKNGRHHNRLFVRLRAHEITNPDLHVSDDELIQKWRAGKVRGGSYCPDSPIIDLTGDNNLTKHRQRGQRYTHADMFCGAGKCLPNYNFLE